MYVWVDERKNTRERKRQKEGIWREGTRKGERQGVREREGGSKHERERDVNLRTN